MKNNNIKLDLFTLNSEELRLIQTKPFKSKLHFAIMLKFFMIENRFPVNDDAISQELIQLISNQLNINTKLTAIDWENRTSERFRQELRDFLGYKKATLADSEKLILWLLKNVLIEAPTIPQACERAGQFFRENRLESFTPRELERYVRSAPQQFEKKFFANIYSQLSARTINIIDCILINDLSSTDDEDISETLNIKLRHLKKDIPAAKLKNVFAEINKIDCIRQAELPNIIFENLPRKLMQKYYLRIMAELPSNIVDHDPETRYSTMAIFCYILKVDGFKTLNQNLQLN